MNSLPESFRQSLFESISEQAGRQIDLDYAKAHVFEFLPMLQQAVNKVAFHAFQSLSKDVKKQIGSKVCDRFCNPNLKDEDWKQIYVSNNIPGLLKTMHSYLGDLTPELQRILDKWVDEGEPGEQRDRARSVIIEFLKDRSKTKLELSSLDLKGLPPIFDKEPFVLRLETLKLDANILTSLPAEICLLQNLTSLNLSHNKLSTLPAEISQLKKLTNLLLFGNQITSLPEQIGQLESLRDLNITYNQLTSLPGQIGHLKNLEDLNLSNNYLVSIPEQIGLLQNLTRLNLSSNQTLQGLPNQLLHFRPSCEVSIYETGLSEHVRANLQEACNAPGYRGPRIGYSMEHMEDRHGEELNPLPTLIAELFSVIREEPRALPHLDQLDEAQKGSIQSWLSRLSDTADYRRHGEFQKAFVKQIISYLQQANDDPQFREAFLNIIADAAETCGDRISLSILHVGIASRLRLITDIHELRKFLTGTVWSVQMLEEIARQKTETLRFFDEIEVYLGYPIMLREKLGLEISVKEMLYFRCSALKQTDLTQASEFVMRQQSNEHAVCAYLASREDWIQALRAQYPQRCAEIDEENYQELEAAGEDQEKLDQLKAHQKQRWEALTARELARQDALKAVTPNLRELIV
ncbi:MAG: hypothetical protein JSR39_07340 [Verrucomicrobia bacterium]|nr:hypothetical protein [Verrucomicrobiota bacterium]